MMTAKRPQFATTRRIASPLCGSMVIACLGGMLFLNGCAHVGSSTRNATPQVWEQTEITLTSQRSYTNAYTYIEVYVEFRHGTAKTIRRPAFWDGGNLWRVRFAAPEAGVWVWRTTCSEAGDGGLQGQEGSLIVSAYAGKNPRIQHGLLRMSPGHRNVVQADGTPFILVGDTSRSPPWRDTAARTT